MNCRIAPIDARRRRVALSLAGIGTQLRVALQHGPGEGPGGSS